MKILFLVVMLSFTWIEMTFSQVRINCTIFVDGKIPRRGTIMNGRFEISSENIPFTYIVGEIHLDSFNVEKLKTLDDESIIDMRFTYLDNKYVKHQYSGEILKRWIFYEYLIINITNLSKRKNKFYFSYDTPAEIRKPNKNEYNPLE